MWRYLSVAILAVLVVSKADAQLQPKSQALMARLRTDKKLREDLKKDWKAVFLREGLPIPSGNLVVVEPPPGAQVLVLPPLEQPPPIVPSPALPVGRGSNRPGTTERRCDTCDPPDGDPPPREPPPVPSEVVTTLTKLHFKRWNQNPFGPGCKNEGRLSFTIPADTKLESITIGEADCGPGPSGQDATVGRYFDSHVALGLVAGAVTLTDRPSSGVGPGPKSAAFHWWFNQWGHVGFKLCVNVRHKPAVSVATQEFFDHVNMDDGLKAYPVKTPICVDKLGVKVSGADESNLKIGPDIGVRGCDNGAIWWFGCKNDNGQYISF